MKIIGESFSFNHKRKRAEEAIPNHKENAFIGAQPGRWRVKAKSEYGESEWSKWFYFRFWH